MAKSQSTRRDTVPAVAYYRMSSDKQDASIGDQRNEVERYAIEHGYHIVREYVDEGISGDATERRTQFQAMHKAACNGRDFTAILVWDIDRFGRFDSMEAGYWVHPLRRAGVRLVSVADGVLEWDDFTGRVMYSIKAEGKHQFLRDLSRNTMRSKLAAAQQGYWLGKVPFGYRLESDATASGKRKRCRLVLSDAAAVDTVRRIFALYLRGHSLRAIAIILNGEGAPCCGKCWSSSTVQQVLINETYTGTYRWNVRQTGKYYSIAAGEVAERKRGRSSERDWIVRQDNHPAIIDRTQFDQVQLALYQRRRQTTPHRNGGGFLLSGLCRCGKCGAAMVGRADRNTNKPRYICKGNVESGKCDRNSVSQEALLDNIVAALQDKVLAPQNVERIKAALRRRLASNVDRVDRADLNRRLATVDAKLAKAKRRLVEVESDLLDVVQSEVRRLLADQDRLQAAIKAARTPRQPHFAAVMQRLDAAIEQLQRLREAVKDSDPGMIREFLRQSIDRVEVQSTKVKYGRRDVYRLERGSIYLRSDELAELSSTTRRESFR